MNRAEGWLVPFCKTSRVTLRQHWTFLARFALLDGEMLVRTISNLCEPVQILVARSVLCEPVRQRLLHTSIWGLNASLRNIDCLNVYQIHR